MTTDPVPHAKKMFALEGTLREDVCVQVLLLLSWACGATVLCAYMLMQPKLFSESALHLLRCPLLCGVICAESTWKWCQHPVRFSIGEGRCVCILSLCPWGEEVCGTMSRLPVTRHGAIFGTLHAEKKGPKEAAIRRRMAHLKSFSTCSTVAWFACICLFTCTCTEERRPHDG